MKEAKIEGRIIGYSRVNGNPQITIELDRAPEGLSIPLSGLVYLEITQ